jgi:hypothetical protein
MKRVWIVVLLAVTVGCANAKTKARKEAKPMTMAEWISLANSKQTPCKEEGFGGGGSNGYNSWSETCLNGVTVYKDTTEESQRREAAENAHKSELANALITRCLTAKEFAEVTHMGYQIYTRNMQPYSEEDLQSRFNAALMTQQILRMKCP